MFLNELDIKYIEFNVLNKKSGAILKEKYYYFSDNADREDDAIFMALVMESLLKYKGNSNNIEIHILCDSIVINCFYTKMFNKTGGYNRTIENYLKLMHDIEKYHNEYLEIIEQFNR